METFLKFESVLIGFVFTEITQQQVPNPLSLIKGSGVKTPWRYVGLYNIKSKVVSSSML